jgi:hypothetical protein
LILINLRSFLLSSNSLTTSEISRQKYMLMMTIFKAVIDSSRGSNLCKSLFDFSYFSFTKLQEVQNYCLTFYFILCYKVRVLFLKILFYFLNFIYHLDAGNYKQILQHRLPIILLFFLVILRLHLHLLFSMLFSVVLMFLCEFNHSYFW